MMYRGIMIFSYALILLFGTVIHASSFTDYFTIDQSQLKISDDRYGNDSFTITPKFKPTGLITITFSASTEVTVDYCSVQFSETDYKTGKKITVYPGVSISTVTTDTTVKATITVKIETVEGAVSYMQGLISTVVVIRTFHPAAVCSSIGDPHISTFDNNQYSYYGAGTFWLLKSDLLEVMTTQYICMPGFSCNKAVAVRYKSKTMTFSINENATISKGFLHHQNNNISGVNVFVANRKHISVTIEDGVTIDIVVGFWEATESFYINVVISITGHYKEKVTGLCGNYDGIAANDYYNDAGCAAFMVPDNYNIFMHGNDCVQPSGYVQYGGQVCSAPPPPSTRSVISSTTATVAAITKPATVIATTTLSGTVYTAHVTPVTSMTYIAATSRGTTTPGVTYIAATSAPATSLLGRSTSIVTSLIAATTAPGVTKIAATSAPATSAPATSLLGRSTSIVTSLIAATTAPGVTYIAATSAPATSLLGRSTSIVTSLIAATTAPGVTYIALTSAHATTAATTILHSGTVYTMIPTATATIAGASKSVVPSTTTVAPQGTPTPSVDAISFCTQLFASVECGNGVDVSFFLQACISDTIASGDMAGFASSTFLSFQVVCQRQTQCLSNSQHPQDKSAAQLIISNGYMSADACENKCQNGGTCGTNGCSCPAGYSGADCSVELQAASSYNANVNGASVPAAAAAIYNAYGNAAADATDYASTNASPQTYGATSPSANAFNADPYSVLDASSDAPNVNSPSALKASLANLRNSTDLANALKNITGSISGSEQTLNPVSVLSLLVVAGAQAMMFLL